MKKYQLMAPGPTPVPSEVLLAMAQPMIHHRTPQYEALFVEVRAGLKKLVWKSFLSPARTSTNSASYCGVRWWIIGCAIARRTSLGTGVGPGAINWYFFMLTASFEESDSIRS